MGGAWPKTAGFGSLFSQGTSAGGLVATWSAGPMAPGPWQASGGVTVLYLPLSNRVGWRIGHARSRVENSRGGVSRHRDLFSKSSVDPDLGGRQPEGDSRARARVARLCRQIRPRWWTRLRPPAH